MKREHVIDSPTSRGRTLYLKYLDGERLTRNEAILAKCAECMNMFVDGRIDCEISNCPLYLFMPYRNSRSTTLKGKR